jgi:hypothetical protein
VPHPKTRREERLVLTVLQRLRPLHERLPSLFTPDTLRRWHRELVRRKWDGPHRINKRKTIPLKTQLVVWRMSQENPTWGYQRIQGELQKIGTDISATSIRRITAPKHRPGPKRDTWRQFMRSQASSIIACDLFTVESVKLKTLHVLFFIELHTLECSSEASPTGRQTSPGRPRSPATSQRRERTGRNRSASSCTTATSASKTVRDLVCEHCCECCCEKCCEPISAP